MNTIATVKNIGLSSPLAIHNYIEVLPGDIVKVILTTETSIATKEYKVVGWPGTGDGMIVYEAASWKNYDMVTFQRVSSFSNYLDGNIPQDDSYYSASSLQNSLASVNKIVNELRDLIIYKGFKLDIGKIEDSGFIYQRGNKLVQYSKDGSITETELNVNDVKSIIDAKTGPKGDKGDKGKDSFEVLGFKASIVTI